MAALMRSAKSTPNWLMWPWLTGMVRGEIGAAAEFSAFHTTNPPLRTSASRATCVAIAGIEKPMRLCATSRARTPSAMEPERSGSTKEIARKASLLTIDQRLREMAFAGAAGMARKVEAADGEGSECTSCSLYFAGH